MIQLIKNLFSKSVSGGFSDIVNSSVSQVAEAADLTQTLKDAYAEYGGEWDAEVNIFGIRNKSNPLSDVFDDTIGIQYIDPLSGESIVRLYKGTTDPGKYRIQKGKAAHMALGFQKDVWVIGRHKGSEKFIVEPALIALWAKDGQPLTIWVDENGNGLKDAGEVSKKDWDGALNCHPASASYVGNKNELIGHYSYGCQVIQSRRDWNEFIAIIVNSNRYKANKKVRWSYMLFDMNQLSWSAQ